MTLSTPNCRKLASLLGVTSYPQNGVCRIPSVLCFLTKILAGFFEIRVVRFWDKWFIQGLRLRQLVITVGALLLDYERTGSHLAGPT